MSSEPTILYVVLKFPKSNKDLILFARSVYAHMADNDHFPSPNPALWLFAEHIAALEAAETKAATRAKGSAAARDAACRRVKADLHHLRDYVQGILEALPAGVDPAEVVASAFMSLKRRSRYDKAELAALHGRLSGMVLLLAKAVAEHATYYWEYSLDQITWTCAPETMQASTEIAGLVPGKTYHFRFRALTREGKGEYAQVVSLMVL